MKIHVSHVTRYEYGREVQFLPHYLYLHPRESPLLQVQQFQFTFSPEATVHWIRDDHDNILACAYIGRNAQVLEIRSEFEVETHDTQPLNFIVKQYAVNFPFTYEPLHAFNLAAYLVPPSNETQAALRGWLGGNFSNPPRETVAYVMALGNAIRGSLRCQRREEPGIQTSLRTLELGSGSCRDFAVLLIEIARTQGLAARFVSGYYYDSEMPPAAPGSMHAWAEVYIPGAGWKGIDPSSGLMCNDAYVPVAHAAVAESVNPVQGSYVTAVAADARLYLQVLIEKRTGGANPA